MPYAGNDPSPLHFVNHPLTERYGIALWMKRDDMLDPCISGNKWRKLGPLLQAFRSSGKAGMVTFGGAFSNHIAAMAEMGKREDIPVIGIIRGEAEAMYNPTLQEAQEKGMMLRFADRETYRRKEEAGWCGAFCPEAGDFYVVPEGGACTEGVRGAMQILPEISIPADLVVVPCGTGTTMAGLILSARPGQEVWGMNALKGKGRMKNQVDRLLRDAGKQGLSGHGLVSWHVDEDFHFGGYACWNKALLDFVHGFYQYTNILLDPVYTGKMMLGLFHRIRQGTVPKGCCVVAVHTGGLQGWKGFQSRWGISVPGAATNSDLWKTP